MHCLINPAQHNNNNFQLVYLNCIYKPTSVLISHQTYLSRIILFYCKHKNLLGDSYYLPQGLKFENVFHPLKYFTDPYQPLEGVDKIKML